MSSSALTATLLVLAGVSTCLSQTVDYCSPNLLCPKGKINTLCKYKKNTWGAACPSLDKSSFVITNEDKKFIVDYHNQLRRKVAKGLETRGPQPPASNMRQLVWDDEIAVMAQTHAQQCVFGRDDCRSVDRFYVGQNLAKQSSTCKGMSSSWKTSIDLWYSEVKDMTNNIVKEYQDPPSRKIIVDYTQMVWADTSRIGCGLSPVNTSVTIFGKVFNDVGTMHVCNYGPGGNYYTLPVYSQGRAGSKCPKGTKNNDGLCL